MKFMIGLSRMSRGTIKYLTAGRRVDAIVSNHHRGSYHKAAGILVAG